MEEGFSISHPAREYPRRVLTNLAPSTRIAVPNKERIMETYTVTVDGVPIERQTFEAALMDAVTRGYGKAWSIDKSFKD